MLRILDNEGELCVHLTDVEMKLTSEQMSNFMKVHVLSKCQQLKVDGENIFDRLCDVPFFCYTDVDNGDEFMDWMSTDYKEMTMNEFVNDCVKWAVDSLSD